MALWPYVTGTDHLYKPSFRTSRSFTKRNCSSYGLSFIYQPSQFPAFVKLGMRLLRFRWDSKSTASTLIANTVFQFFINMEEIFDVWIQHYVDRPLKLNEKDRLIGEISDMVKEQTGRRPISLDSYYASRKSLESPNTLELIVNLLSTSVGIFGIVTWLLSRFEGTKKIFVRQKNGDFFQVRDGIAEDDLRKALDSTKSERQSQSERNGIESILSADLIKDEENEKDYE